MSGKNFEGKMMNIENTREVLGLFHHSISQHTKEIAAINTSLAALLKNQTENNFKQEVKEFMDDMSTKFDRLSTSLELLTKQVFQNEDAIKNLIKTSTNKLESEKNSNEVNNNSDVLKFIQELRDNQTSLENRVSELENNRNAVGISGNKSVKLNNQSNIVVSDIRPSNNFNIPDISPMDAAEKLACLITFHSDEINRIKEIQDENIDRMSSIIQFLQDSMDEINNRIINNPNISAVAKDIQRIKESFGKYITKDELDLALKGQSDILFTKLPNGSSRKSHSFIRPSTGLQPCNRALLSMQATEVSPTTVTYTMINGDNISKPSTVNQTTVSYSKWNKGYTRK